MISSPFIACRRQPQFPEPAGFLPPTYTREQRLHRVLILDADRSYARLLGAALESRKQPLCQVSFAANESEALLLLKKQKSPEVLILSETFPLGARLNDQLKGYPRLINGKGPGMSKKADLQPGMRIEEICSRLSSCLEKAAPGGISSRPLIALYAFDARLRKAWLLHFMRQQLQQGRPVYYVPFLPSYEVSLPLQFSRGPELSSLLLMLQTGVQPPCEALGPCFEFQQGAYYALRPGGRAEDLRLSPLSVQKQLLQLLRRYIRSRSEASIAILEMAQEPLSRLRELVSLSDIFVCNLPGGKGYAATNARREISTLISELPENVHFLELSPPAREKYHEQL